MIHSGFADAGHYYSFIKEKEKWYEFNDDYINENGILLPSVVGLTESGIPVRYIGFSIKT